MSAPPGMPLEPGRDLVLHADGADLRLAPPGTLADDFLDAGARAAVDEEANAALVAWRVETEQALSADGVSLGHLFEGELHPEVFLRERHGLRAFAAWLAEAPRGRVRLHGADRDLATALASVAESRDVSLELAGESPPPVYPLAFARSIGRRRPWVAAARELVGAPAILRGELLLMPGSVTAPLWRGLEARGVKPVVDLTNPPGGGAADLARRLARGGWVAHPGRRLRRKALASVTAALGYLEAAGGAAEDPLGWLERRRARTLLSQRAPEALANLAALRRSFSSGRLRGAVVPSDGTVAGRVLLAAASEWGAAVTHLQHGFFSDQWRLGGAPAPYVDGLTAPRAAAWSEAQRALIAPHARGTVEVTGNPAAAGLAGRVPAVRGGPLLVLVQPPGIGAAAIDRRAPARYVQAVLGAAAADPGSHVILRPHPLDPSDYSGLARDAGGSVEVAAAGPLDPLLVGASACVGPVSTATLTALAMGVPTVHLDVTGASYPAPFDGGGEVPSATSEPELAERLARVEPGEGAEAARDALGARPDAVDRVLDLALRA